MEFEIDEVRALIKGKFDFRTCIECNGKGWVLVDDNLGEVVQAMHPEGNPSDYYKDQCEDCHGLGGLLRINV
jgi:DnaJ-class molecular chaperone